jgi:hypothetical protein
VFNAMVAVDDPSAPRLPPQARRIAMARSLLTFVVAAQLGATGFAQIALDGNEVVHGTPDPAGRFGSAVVIDGARMLVGAPESSAVLPAAGYAEVFERDANGVWVSEDVLTGSIVQSLARFGRTVELAGDDALVGYATVARVDHFERDANGDWSLVQSLTPPASDLVSFGREIALDGDRLAVVSRASGSFGQGPGALSIFERSGGGPFVHVQTVIATSIGGPPLTFGTSLDIEGDRVVVGHARAPLSFTPDVGVVHVFERDTNGVWSEQQYVTSPQTFSTSYFGASLELDGGRLAVGRPFIGPGFVDVFELNGAGVFVPVATLGSTATPVGDGFGSGVAIDGDRIAVGVPASDAAVSNGGLVVLFERAANGTWFERTRFGPSAPAVNEQFGIDDHAIDLEGELLVCGSPTRNGFTGSAFVFELGWLQRGAAEVSLAAGGTQSLMLRAGEARGGDVFIVLGSASGTSPAIPLAPGVDLPLVFDAYTNLGLSFATPVQPGLGVLDAFGRADTGFHVPTGANPSFAGAVFHHAYVTIDLVSFAVGASNAVDVQLVP